MARNERSAGFIIYRRPSKQSPVLYLLLNYGRHWDFVKGHVEPGEDDLAAAVRELHEETALANPKIIPGFNHQIVYFFRDRKKGLVQKTVVFFLAETHDAELVLSPEHTGFDFLPIDAALKRVTFPTARQVLRAADGFLNPTATSATILPDELTGPNHSEAGR